MDLTRLITRVRLALPVRAPDEPGVQPEDLPANVADIPVDEWIAPDQGDKASAVTDDEGSV